MTAKKEILSLTLEAKEGREFFAQINKLSKPDPRFVLWARTVQEQGLLSKIVNQLMKKGLAKNRPQALEILNKVVRESLPRKIQILAINDFERGPYEATRKSRSTLKLINENGPGLSSAADLRRWGTRSHYVLLRYLAGESNKAVSGDSSSQLELFEDNEQPMQLKELSLGQEEIRFRISKIVKCIRKTNCLGSFQNWRKLDGPVGDLAQELIPLLVSLLGGEVLKKLPSPATSYGRYLRDWLLVSWGAFITEMEPGRFIKEVPIFPKTKDHFSMGRVDALSIEFQDDSEIARIKVRNSRLDLGSILNWPDAPERDLQLIDLKTVGDSGSTHILTSHEVAGVPLAGHVSQMQKYLALGELSAILNHRGLRRLDKLQIKDLKLSRGTILYCLADSEIVGHTIKMTPRQVEGFLRGMAIRIVRTRELAEIRMVDQSIASYLQKMACGSLQTSGSSSKRTNREERTIPLWAEEKRLPFLEVLSQLAGADE